MKILVGIPAYNEDKVIGDVIKSVNRRILGMYVNILVVDDGSTDQTAKTAKENGIMVLQHCLNRGLGGALKTIFAFAKSGKYDILITFDADGQHKSTCLKQLIKPLIKHECDIVIGSRWLNIQAAPISRILINRIANMATQLMCGLKTSDSQSGLRAFNRKAIDRISIQTDGMEVSSEIFREIKKHKLSFKEIPIPVIYTSYSLSKGQKLSNAPSVIFNLLLRLIE